MKKYRVEFNTTGFYQGQGVFEVLDETAEVEADNAQEAIECCIDWFVDTDINAYGGTYDADAPEYIYDENGDIDADQIREHYEDMAWIAMEILVDEDGNEYYGDAEYKD
ncbi:MAG: hypothetical protein K6F71_04475 [Ruminococcus sp.]|uniref:hypothetical protein n=1 Tax=Ruminococcus sp. TaxID=41978 RepID=UPI0025CF6C57|nr:hypothetical protein [Ruminococcus sp.]MCR5540076.1 hypothetical protein [Ruminococcus sp.]